MTRRHDLAALTLRLALGAVFLAHGLYLKAFVFTLPGTAEFFTSLGLPGLLGYAVFAVETLGGLALVTGIAVTPFALALAAVSAGATWAHAGAGWLFSNEGGGWEFPALLVATSLVQALLGSGRYRIRVPTPRAWRSRSKLAPA